MVIVQADVQKGSFLAMFDAKDGREVWRVTRTDVPTWSTPTIHVVNGQTQILVNGMRHVGAYDFKTGKEIWKLSGGGDIPVPTPVVSDGLVYITNAHGPQSPVYAIKETAAGDVSLKDPATSSDAVAWSAPRSGGYMCTPLVYRGLVYIVRYNGVLNVFDAKSGEKKYERGWRRDVGVHLVPVANDGRSSSRAKTARSSCSRPDRSTRCGDERDVDAGARHAGDLRRAPDPADAGSADVDRKK
jgi:outer membrane protein assembly factor BamB